MSIKKIIVLSIFFSMHAHPFFSPLRSSAPQSFLLMIDPAGDAKHMGRKIDDSFERGITLQCAQALKSILEERAGIRVVLTRFPGEALEPLQSANFSNRLNTNLYLSIHFYQEHAPRPQLYLYRFSHGTDITKINELAWYPYDHAHQINTRKTDSWINKLHTGLGQYKQALDCRGVFALPFKPIVGITAPAIALEIGIQKSDDWHSLLEPIVASLLPIIVASTPQESVAEEHTMPSINAHE